MSFGLASLLCIPPYQDASASLFYPGFPQSKTDVKNKNCTISSILNKKGGRNANEKPSCAEGTGEENPVFQNMENWGKTGVAEWYRGAKHVRLGPCVGKKRGAQHFAVSLRLVE
jgi:hypothetical protein